MTGGFDRRPAGPGKRTLTAPVEGTVVGPGKRTLTEAHGPVAPSQLPYRAEMERSFGRSLRHVQAYTGVAAELAPHGAEALATGNVVAFADASPAPPIVAHEVAHAVQNQQAGMAAPMASGVVAPRDCAAEAEADAIAHQVAAHGPGVRLPPVTAVPTAHVHLAPKLLVPADGAPAPRTSIQLPDADHPLRRDADGEPNIQTDKASGPGTAAPLRGRSWKSLAEVAESVDVQDDSGDTLHIDLTYRLESRPAEISDVPDLWIHTERKAQLTISSGEHAVAAIVGQARIQLAPDEARDPKAAIAKASMGADHHAQIYLAEAQQYVNLHGSGGRASLLADAAESDVLAYGDPLRTLVGLKDLLKQQHVAGHGADVAKMHARAQRLLAEAKCGCAALEREIASVASHHDPHPGRVAPVRFLVGDIEAWLAANQQAGRDSTEDTRLVNQAHGELLRLLDTAERTHAPRRNQLDDALNAPVRFAERTAAGVGEVGAMAVDAVVLGVEALGTATGLWSFDFDPVSTYAKTIKASGADTSTALVTMVNGFADEWTDAIERAKHGDYRSMTDVSIDALMMIDGARTGGTIALDKAEALAGKLGSIAKSARAIASGVPAEARNIAVTASRLPAETRAIAAAMADGADAFVARLRAGGMHMATEGGGGGSGPNLGGLNAETLSEAAQAAKNAFKDKRLGQETAKHTNHGAGRADPSESRPPGSAIADHTARPPAEHLVHEVFGSSLSPETVGELTRGPALGRPVLEHLAARGVPAAEQLGQALAKVPSWPENARLGLVKLAASDTPDAIRLLAKVIPNIETEGMNTWALLASRVLKDQAQLLDLERSLNKAIELRRFDPTVAVEVDYYEGKRVSRAERDESRARSDFDKKQHVNFDVESDTERWEMKRVRPILTEDGQILDQVKEGARKYCTSKLLNFKNGGPKMNIVDVDFGDRVQIAMLDEAGMRARVEAYVMKNDDVRQYVDMFMIHINIDGAAHVIKVGV